MIFRVQSNFSTAGQARTRSAGGFRAQDFGFGEEFGEPRDHSRDANQLWSEERLDKTLRAMYQMDHQGIPISRDVLCGILRGCTTKKDVATGRRVHSLMVSSGLDSIAYHGDHLIRLFASCGSLRDANRAFGQVSEPTLYTWNSIISANAKLEEGERALELYRKMQLEGIKPDNVTFSCILKACSNLGNIQLGRSIQNQIIESGLKVDAAVGNTLVDMYAKCGSLGEAHNIFGRLPDRDIVSWGAMIGGYAMHGHGLAALKLFWKMQQEGMLPNQVILLSIVKACSGIGDLRQGRLIHEQIVRNGLESDVTIGSTLVDMYAKCARLDDAHEVFDTLPKRNVVSWGAIMGGYTQHEHGLLVIDLFEKMQQEYIEPNTVIFLCILKACGTVGALCHGRSVHDQIIKYRLASDVVIGSTLVDMYAKCGSLEEACNIFHKLPYQNVVSWSAIIAGYARSGNCRMVMECFGAMQKQGLKPDNVIFTNILTACTQAGLVEQGRQYFKLMREQHGMRPSMEQYSCMIHLLGSAGCLNEAEDLLQSIPISPDIGVWRSLLTSCRMYGNTELGSQCFDQVTQSDPDDASGYVLMSSIYANAHMWESVDRTHELRKFSGVQKTPGKACIEVNRNVHEFIVGAKSHQVSGEVQDKVNTLSRQMKEKGYKPLLESVLELISDEDKEIPLVSQKASKNFMLTDSPKGATIQTTMDLQACTDCHNAVESVPIFSHQWITVMDAYQVHCSYEGLCH